MDSQQFVKDYILQKSKDLLYNISYKYGADGNFTYEELIDKFIKNNEIVLVDDNFNKKAKRGRPKKNINLD